MCGDVKIEKWEERGEEGSMEREGLQGRGKINEPAVNHPDEKLWS